jgi:DNA-binding cell septation regulator SpoVG
VTVAIVKWQRLPQPFGKTLGFIAVSWHGLIVDAIPVTQGPRGLFISMPSRRVRNGRWLKVVRFKTVREETAFKTEVLAALMRAYPQDFVGFEVPLQRGG